MLGEMIDGVQLHEMQNIITRNGPPPRWCGPNGTSGAWINDMIHVTLGRGAG